jgi:hypothetical protein
MSREERDSHEHTANPTNSEQEARRWHHRDLDVAGDRLNPRQLWAELVSVERELARRVTGRRPRIVYVDADGPVDDVQWLEARARALRRAQRDTDGR